MTSISPQEIFRRRLAEVDQGRCYLRPDGSLSGLRYGPCDGRLQGHHLIPQRVLKRHALGGIPISVVLSDYRNGILVCERHHHLLDMRRIRLKLLDLPSRLTEFLDQFTLWDEAIRIYVRPPGHSLKHADEATPDAA